MSQTSLRQWKQALAVSCLEVSSHPPLSGTLSMEENLKHNSKLSTLDLTSSHSFIFFFLNNLSTGLAVKHTFISAIFIERYHIFLLMQVMFLSYICCKGKAKGMLAFSCVSVPFEAYHSLESGWSLSVVIRDIHLAMEHIL
jgi:hypothetical protein